MLTESLTVESPLSRPRGRGGAAWPTSVSRPEKHAACSDGFQSECLLSLQKLEVEDRKRG